MRTRLRFITQNLIENLIVNLVRSIMTRHWQVPWVGIEKNHGPWPAYDLSHSYASWLTMTNEHISQTVRNSENTTWQSYCEG